jgi:hypothetical protein
MGYDTMYEYEESGRADIDRQRAEKGLAPTRWVEAGHCQHYHCFRKGLNGRDGYPCAFAKLLILPKEKV